MTTTRRLAFGVQLRLLIESTPREGDPADNITVDLVADSSGAPGSVLESVTISGSAIPRMMGWVVFALTNTTVLDSDSGYGIVVKRSGANSPTDYYEIDMDKDATYAGGALRQVVLGVVIGLPVCLLVSWLASGTLGWSVAFTPVAYVGVPLLLMATAVLSTVLPARHATRVTPTEALRQE